MEPDSRMLQEILELSRENNRMLRAVRRASFWGGVFKVIWWAALIGVPIALYYYILAPYVQDAQQTYQNIKGGAEQVQGLGSNLPPELKNLLQNYGVNL